MQMLQEESQIIQRQNIKVEKQQDHQKQREKGKTLLERKFKDGNMTSLWFDPWIFGKSLIDLLGWNNMYLLGNATEKVQSII